MRLVRSTAILLALVIASPALANDPVEVRQAGETLALRADGPFSEHTFKVIRNQRELDEAFRGQPPRSDIDFAAGPLVLYAAPGGKSPLIVDVTPFNGRMDVRVKGVAPSALAGRVEGTGGAAYHLVQVPSPAHSVFNLSRSSEPKRVNAVLAPDGSHFRDALPLTGRHAVLVRSTRGDVRVVSPAANPDLTVEVPASWTVEAPAGPNVPQDAAFLEIPRGQTVHIGGSMRYHPTDPSLLTELGARPQSRGKLMALEADLYQPGGPRVDVAIDVHAIDPLKAGHAPVVVGPDADAQIAMVLDTVFPFKAPIALPDAGLAGAPTLELPGKIETTTLPAASELDAGLATATQTIAPETTTAPPAGDESEDATVAADTTDTTQPTAGPVEGGSLVGVVADASKEIEDAAAEAAPSEQTDGPDMASSQALTKTEPQATAEATAEDAETPVAVTDGPDADAAEPLVKTETELSAETAETAEAAEETEVHATCPPPGDQALGEPETPAAVTDAEEPETVATAAPTAVADGPDADAAEELTATADASQVQETEAQVQETEAQVQETEAQVQETEAVAYPYTGRVNVSELNVREAANSDAKGLLVFLRGDEVKIVGQADDGWLIVEVPQLQGYVHKNLIDFPNGKGKKGGAATVNTSYVNLRTTPSSSSRVSVMLRQDFPLTVRRTGHRGSWLNVTSAGTFQAFVHGKYVDKVAE